MITRSGNGASASEVLFTAPVTGCYAYLTNATLDPITGSGGALIRYAAKVSDAVNYDPDSTLVAQQRSLTEPPGTTEICGVIFLRRGCTVSLSVTTSGTISDAPWTFSVSVHLMSGQDLAVE